MTLPQKNIKIGLFFNERLPIPEHQYANTRSQQPSYRNPMVVSMRPVASLAPAKSSYGSQFACSQFLKTEKSTFGKVLKFQNPLFLSKPRKISLPTNQSIDLKSSIGLNKSELHKSSHISANNSFWSHESSVLEVRKDIESKFKRTRMILR